mmetsp:Transcript_30704/g.65864  ORF Transcript_30704/g.65864 Transcript_30704/m.65864 type:complete len:403 (+) Transcript_30704:308-1516(+)
MLVTENDHNFDLGQWQAGGTTSFSQTCFAEYWSNLPSIVPDSADENKHSKDAVQLVDPYDFRHRAALAKYLIEHTGGEEIWGTGDGYCSKHWCWAYTAQLDWQHRSGRFEDPATWQDIPPAPLGVGVGHGTEKKSTEISKRSWWGYMNAGFSVASYCGAAEAGFVPTISMSDESLLNDVGFRACVGHWKKFWEDDHAAFLDSCSPGNSKDEEERSMINLYRTLWKTHGNIVETGLKHSKELQLFLPKEDLVVGLGWSNVVELLAATNFPLLSLNALLKFGAGYLPTLRMAGPKSVRWLKENRSMEHTTLGTLSQIKDTPEGDMRKACRFFSRISRWKFARDNLPRTLHVLTHGTPIQKTLALSRAVVLALFPRSFFETSVAVFAASVIAMGKLAKTKRLSFG